MDNSSLKKYAKLLVKKGINLQKGQILVISSPIECSDFARVVAETAFQEGASDVPVYWIDEKLSKIRFTYGEDKIFEEFPKWRKEFNLGYGRKGAAFLSIHADDPELFKDVDTKKIGLAQKSASIALEEHRKRLMSNENVWCVASIPTEAWAKKVFPGLSGEEAIEKLWDAIFKTVRVDKADPVAAWDEHCENLKKQMKAMNSYKFKFLHYKNSAGTDLKIELPEGHIWLGGSEFTPGGIEFIANMPTEEVFTLPKKTGVNGTVVSSKPLNYNGNLIEDFTITFKDGRIVDYSAKAGNEVLKSLVETDEGSHYLGEVALVPYDSPISNSNILFYNTLFDENASCHLAIGKAYPVCLEGGNKMSKEELEAAGVNDALVHEDFMVGTKDLSIVGITADGKEVTVFKDGNFAF